MSRPNLFYLVSSMLQTSLSKTPSISLLTYSLSINILQNLQPLTRNVSPFIQSTIPSSPPLSLLSLRRSRLSTMQLLVRDLHIPSTECVINDNLDYCALHLYLSLYHHVALCMYDIQLGNTHCQARETQGIYKYIDILFCIIQFLQNLPDTQGSPPDLTQICIPTQTPS